MVSDLECFIDGKEAHKKRENLWLFLDKESLLSGLSEKIIGMNKGEERDVEVDLPEKYPDKNIAGKQVHYRILAKDIKMRKLPELNDEFAKGLSKDNLEELKALLLKDPTTLVHDRIEKFSAMVRHRQGCRIAEPVPGAHTCG